MSFMVTGRLEYTKILGSEKFLQDSVSNLISYIKTRICSQKKEFFVTIQVGHSERIKGRAWIPLGRILAEIDSISNIKKVIFLIEEPEVFVEPFRKKGSIHVFREDLEVEIQGRNIYLTDQILPRINLKISFGGGYMNPATSSVNNVAGLTSLEITGNYNKIILHKTKVKQVTVKATSLIISQFLPGKLILRVPEVAINLTKDSENERCCLTSLTDCSIAYCGRVPKDIRVVTPGCSAWFLPKIHGRSNFFNFGFEWLFSQPATKKYPRYTRINGETISLPAMVYSETAEHSYSTV